MIEASNGVGATSGLEQLLGEQARDWMRGDCKPVSAYLMRRLAPAEQAEAAIELIHQEIIFRLRSGETPRLEDYGADFPDLAKPISEILELHEAISLPTPFLPALGTPEAAGGARASVPLYGLPTIPGYNIERALGTGGMGIVYLADDLALRRKVALKLLRHGFADDPGHRARFEREAAAAAKCQHPNLVQIFHIGQHTGVFYLALEYVEGNTLANYLAGVPQPPREAAKLAEKLARAIDHVHSRGVVHRDLKPANILLTPEGEPKITDFGLARLDDSTTRTEVGALLGTLAYMAPEQASGGPVEVGPPADIHAVGAILYESLTGRPPYRSSTPEKTLQRVLFDDVARPSSLQPETPRDLEAICLKCLEKSPTHRFGTAAELAEDLRRFLDGRPILARPVRHWERCWRWCRRNPRLAAVSAALAATVLVAASVLMGVTYRHNLALRAEVKRTEAKAAAARGNYEAAKSTIQSMLTRLDDRQFAGTPKLMQLAGDQMEDALTFYNRIRQQDDANDPAIRYDSARALGLLSTVQFDSGHFEQAENQVRKALELIKVLRSEQDGNSEYLGLQTECMLRLGTYLGALGHREQALTVREESLCLSKELARVTPDDPSHQELLATCEDACASCLREFNRLSDARAHYRQAIEIRERLDPAKLNGLTKRHAATLMNDGVNLWSMQQFSQAEARFRKAEELKLAVPAEHRGSVSLGHLYVNWSGLLYQSRRFGEALDRAEAGLRRVEPYRQIEPNDAEARGVCLKLHGNRGLALSGLGNHRESAKEWERVIALSTEPAPPGYRVQLAIELARAGELPRALAQAQLVKSAADATSVDRYNLGCLYALCAASVQKDATESPAQRSRLVDSHIKDAMRWLKSAREAGFFNNAENRYHAKKDPDLAILFDRDEFRRIIEPPQTNR